MRILDNVIGVKEASEITGLSAGTIKNYCREGKITSKNIGNTWVIDKFKLKERMKMKQTYNEIMKSWVGNDKVFVSYFENVNELLDDGVDKEVLDEEFYVFGNPEATPSKLEEPFIIIEVEGSVDTPIFTAERKEEVLHYLEGNHGEYIKEGN